MKWKFKLEKPFFTLPFRRRGEMGNVIYIYKQALQIRDHRRYMNDTIILISNIK